MARLNIILKFYYCIFKKILLQILLQEQNNIRSIVTFIHIKAILRFLFLTYRELYCIKIFNFFRIYLFNVAFSIINH